MPFDLEGDSVAEEHHWDEHRGSYRGLRDLVIDGVHFIRPRIEGSTINSPMCGLHIVSKLPGGRFGSLSRSEVCLK